MGSVQVNSYHKQSVVSQWTAGYGGDIVMVGQDATALTLPSSLSAPQAEVPRGRHRIRATGKPPQGDVDRGPQDM